MQETEEIVVPRLTVSSLADIAARWIEMARFAWAWAWAWAQVRLFAAKKRQNDWAVYKVYAFEENGAVSNNHKYHELPPRFFCPESWEQDAKDATGWDAVRLEVRYSYQGSKYRMVLRPGDACAFPPPLPTAFRPSVIAAALLGGTVNVDVTRRVIKYQGASKDFHGTRVTVRDMFPFDDHDDNSERFTHMRLIDSNARMRLIRYASDESVAPPGVTVDRIF